MTANEVTDETYDKEESMWIWEDVHKYIFSSVKRENLVGVELSKGEDFWKIAIFTTINEITLRWLIGKKSEAHYIFDQLHNYIFNS